MDRAQLMDMVTRARNAVDECERLRAADILKIADMRAAGQNTDQLLDALHERESECDRHVGEMERLLDELDGLPAIE